MAETRVFIVNAGQWGDMRQARGDYDQFVRDLTEILGDVERPVANTGGREKEKVAEVEVVSSVEEAMAKAQRVPLNSRAVLVFVTRGMLEEAKRIKKEHRRLKVVLFTGVFPEDEVIVAGKTVSTPKTFEDIVLHW